MGKSSAQFTLTTAAFVGGERYPTRQSVEEQSICILITIIKQEHNSNSTFAALNLPLTKGNSKVQHHQDSQPNSVSRNRKEVEHHRECQGIIKAKEGG